MKPKVLFWSPAVFVCVLMSSEEEEEDLQVQADLVVRVQTLLRVQLCTCCHFICNSSGCKLSDCCSTNHSVILNPL